MNCIGNTIVEEKNILKSAYYFLCISNGLIISIVLFYSSLVVVDQTSLMRCHSQVYYVPPLNLDWTIK